MMFKRFRANLQGGVPITAENWKELRAQYPVIDERSKMNLVGKYYFFPNYSGPGKWALLPNNTARQEMAVFGEGVN